MFITKLYCVLLALVCRKCELHTTLYLLRPSYNILRLNQEWETIHFRTGSPKSAFISFSRGSQSQLENQHKGDDDDAKEPQPTDSLQAGGIDRVA